MKTILSQIKAAQMLAHDWHYNAKGSSFYAEHLLAEKVTDGLDADSDALIETFYLGEKRTTPPSSGEIVTDALAVYGKVKGDTFPAKLGNAFALLAAHAEELARAGGISIGTKSLLDAVSQKAYLAVGLISRTLTN